ncbi:MAG: hypothetical protein U0990_12710 [Candidatus Nanopelagicales bacterium]|nr:hypothetical protein [Candidatus Nanopelagicales bacterium]
MTERIEVDGPWQRRMFDADHELVALYSVSRTDEKYSPDETWLIVGAGASARLREYLNLRESKPDLAHIAAGLATLLRAKCQYCEGGDVGESRGYHITGVAAYLCPLMPTERAQLAAYDALVWGHKSQRTRLAIGAGNGATVSGDTTANRASCLRRR